MNETKTNKKLIYCDFTVAIDLISHHINEIMHPTGAANGSLYL